MMQLQTLIAFALVFLRSDQELGWPMFGDREIAWTLSLVAVQAVVIVVASLWACRAALRTLAGNRDRPGTAQQFHHRATVFLRAFVIASFAVDILATRWPDICYSPGYSPWLRIVGDLCALLPYTAGLMAVWWLAYPVDRALREQVLAVGAPDGDGLRSIWSRRQYVAFNVRHHILVVGVPIALILYVSNLTRGYASQIRRLAFDWQYAPDALLGVVALAVFVIAPLMLRYIWTTEPLAHGPLRSNLEQLCERIGLRCRNILIWKSRGMMVNAAVMGLVPRVRYVLLSDGLLETMSDRQVEAVFGHEAGHVWHHHIEFFLLFAFVTMLLVSAVMEWLARTTPHLSLTTVQALGGVATLLLWGVGFGWISRRFERQADLFGALCVTPTADECTVPCSVHLEPGGGDECGTGILPVEARAKSLCDPGPRVCATAAALFASALDRVAVLNGIPHEERNWRHSSIANRVRFLTSLANDPNRAIRFDRLVRRTKTMLLVTSVVGAVLAIYYYAVADAVLLR